MSESHPLDPALAKLETIRRSLDLFLDGQGGWWHDGSPFEHKKIIDVFDRGIEIHPDTQEPIVRIGDRWCYFTAEVTPYIVRRITVGANGVVVRLNTGEEVDVPEDGLYAQNERIFVALADGRQAVFDRRSQLDVSSLISQDEEELTIELEGRNWKIVEKSES